MNNPDPIVHLDDFKPKPKNYKQRLEEIPMLRACKETIQTLCANAMHSGNMVKDPIGFNVCSIACNDYVENYIAELEYEGK